jgi:hypothetical protein
MNHPHRGACPRVVSVPTGEISAAVLVDEVVRHAVRGRDLDHVEPAADAKLFDRFGAASLDRHLRLERWVELQSRRRRRRLRQRLKLAIRRRCGGRFRLYGGSLRRQRPIPGTLRRGFEREAQRDRTDCYRNPSRFHRPIIGVSGTIYKAGSMPLQGSRFEKRAPAVTCNSSRRRHAAAGIRLESAGV